METVGVIVGRFQVPELHAGHEYLLRTVFSNHKRILILLGVPETKLSERDPLSFYHRYDMIGDWIKKNIPKSVSHNISIWEIPDVRSDLSWNEFLNKTIKDYSGDDVPLLYGARDSFLKQYRGPHPVCQLFKEYPVSGTEIRSGIIETAHNSVDFRKGIIYASSMKYPTVYSTVDVALLTAEGFLILGRKKGEKVYRLMGGFVDPSDHSIESAARRELYEESGIRQPFDFHYLGNFKIEDWRYKNSKDSVITHLYCTINPSMIAMFPKPGDDIEEIRFFSLSEAYQRIIDEHIPLLHKVRDFMIENHFDVGFKDPSQSYEKYIFMRNDHGLQT